MHSRLVNLTLTLFVWIFEPRLVVDENERRIIIDCSKKDFTEGIGANCMACL